jgi:hypothetical protein
MPETKSLQRWARDSVVLLLAEFAIVAGLFVADVYHHIFFSKTPYLFFLAWVSLRLRGMRWKEIGFERPRNWGRAFGVGIAIRTRHGGARTFCDPATTGSMDREDARFV